MTEDRPPATPGPAQTPTADLDTLDRTAALLTGWTRFSVSYDGRPVAIPPGLTQLHLFPSPTRDHGDCMRLLEFALQQEEYGYPITVRDIGFSPSGWFVSLRSTPDDDDYEGIQPPKWWVDSQATLPLAITRACCAALEAVAGGGAGRGQRCLTERVSETHAATVEQMRQQHAIRSGL